jgi:hypothetical protein
MSRKRLEIDALPEEVELMRIVNIPEAARLAGISKNTLKARFADKIIQITPGRIGMRVRDALKIAEGKLRDRDP